MCLGDGGGTTTTNTVQKNDPWVGVQPYLLGSGITPGAGQPGIRPSVSFNSPWMGVGGAQEGSFNPSLNPSVQYLQYGAQNQQPQVQTPTVEGGGLFGRAWKASNQPVNPYTTMGWNMLTQRAQDPNSSFGASNALLSSTLRGDYLDPSRNPTFMKAAQDAADMARSSAAGLYGGFGGRNFGNSAFQENLGRGISATTNQLFSDQYNRERQLQQQALGLSPLVGNQDIAALSRVGDQQTDQPWAQLRNMQGILSGWGGGTTTGQQQVPYYDNTLAQLGGLGLMAYGLFG